MELLRHDLYGRVHKLPGNCYGTVFEEFMHGHVHYVDHPRPLTPEQWFAILSRTQQMHDAVFGSILVFGGTQAAIKAQCNYGQKAFVEFLERQGAKVVQARAENHTTWIASLPSNLWMKMNKFDYSPYYAKNEFIPPPVPGEVFFDVRAQRHFVDFFDPIGPPPAHVPDPLEVEENRRRRLGLGLGRVAPRIGDVRFVERGFPRTRIQQWWDGNTWTRV